jgi:hypothetical protein
MTSYILAIGIWIAYALMKEASRETAVTLLKSQRWEQSLSDLHTPAKPDSLIPMFEGMVDRAFSKTHSSFQAIERSSSVASPTNDVDVSSVGALNFLR